MVALVTLDEAKDYLEFESNDQDSELSLTISAASEIVLRYIKVVDAADIPATAAESTKAATLLIVGNLTRYKGDEANPETILSPTVRAVLHSLRDPTLA